MAPESLNFDTKSTSELETNKVAKQIMNSLGYFVPENADTYISSQVSSLFLVLSDMF